MPAWDGLFFQQRLLLLLIMAVNETTMYFGLRDNCKHLHLILLYEWQNIWSSLSLRALQQSFAQGAAHVRAYFHSHSHSSPCPFFSFTSSECLMLRNTRVSALVILAYCVFKLWRRPCACSTGNPVATFWGDPRWPNLHSGANNYFSSRRCYFTVLDGRAGHSPSRKAKRTSLFD